MSSPRLVSKLSAWIVVPSALLAVWASAGCEERQSPADRPATVAETFHQLREWRQTGQYAAMRPYIHPSGSEGLIDLLVAVDELVLANAAARSAAERACPGAGIPYDLSRIQDNLELFSRDVQLVSIKEDVPNQAATATIQIAHRLPLVYLRFERTGKTWQYLPGPERPDVVIAIRQMTRSLKQIELSLSPGPATAEQVRREFRTRLGPKIKAFQAGQDSRNSEVAALPPA